MSFLLRSSGPQGLLDQLSSSTTIIGAWSSCRSLKSSTYSAGAMKVRSNEAGTQTNIGFVGRLLNTAALIAVCVGGEKEGVIQWNDQSGNANHLAPQSGAADSVICSTTGTLSFPVTVTGGSSMPMVGFGPGNQAGSTGVAPSMITPIPMPVSFGAVAKHFALVVYYDIKSGGAAFGEICAYRHTGDANSFSTTTSAIHIQRDNSTTSGIYTAAANSLHQAQSGTLAQNALHMLGSLYNSADTILYGDGSAGTGGAYTQTLGSGGSYSVGAANQATTTDNWNGWIAELIIGTFSNSAAAFEAGDWTTMLNNTAAFYPVP